MNRAAHDVILDNVTPPAEVGVKLELMAERARRESVEEAVEAATDQRPLTQFLTVLD